MHSYSSSNHSRSFGRNRRFNSGRPAGRAGRGRFGAFIHPDRFVNKSLSPTTAEPYQPTHQFTEFGLLPQLVTTLKTKGYTSPTAIQDQAIIPAISGQDIIGIANTGTGKTAAFVLPIIQRLIQNQNQFTVLIMAPTRELAVQINDEFKTFAQGLRLYSTLCIGGANINRQMSELRRSPQVVIGTPGRLKDLFNQRVLKLDRVGVVVLDEADRMLDMGFIVDIRFLLSQLPTKRQSLCFSATLTPGVKTLLDGLLINPVMVSVRTSENSNHVEQDVIRVSSKEQKFSVLEGLLRKETFDKVLIFGQTKYGVQRLAENLTRLGIQAEAIHGNKSQPQRQRALQAFKDNRVKVLVATDVAARGLDIPLVSHVINFDQPATYDDYIHRIGRTGRAGNPGQALTFID